MSNSVAMNAVVLFSPGDKNQIFSSMADNNQIVWKITQMIHWGNKECEKDASHSLKNIF